MTSKAMILLCTADLPAKAKVANSVQYNGYFGCNTCTIQGQYLECSMCWPYDPSATTRSHLSILADAKQAIEISNSVKTFYIHLLSHLTLYTRAWQEHNTHINCEYINLGRVNSIHGSSFRSSCLITTYQLYIIFIHMNNFLTPISILKHQHYKAS